MHLAYSENIDIENSIIVLSGEETHHILRTLRMRLGDTVMATDGTGHLYRCTITDDNKNASILSIQESETAKQKRSCKIHIASALTKNPARMEFFIEKAVESGIDIFTPVIFQRSERSVFKAERFRKIAISAMKQSQSLFLPHINEPQSFDNFLKSLNTSNSVRLIAYKTPEAPHIMSHLKSAIDVTILIGPEGDFTPAELEKALAHGFEMVHLGYNRLRTETAALATCMAVNLINKQ